MIRYALHPSKVKSQNDGQIHYVSADDLCELYGVSPLDCIVIDKSRHLWDELTDDLIHLHPRRDGKYELRSIDGQEIIKAVTIETSRVLDL